MKPILSTKWSISSINYHTTQEAICNEMILQLKRINNFTHVDLDVWDSSVEYHIYASK
jgi:hypothetical protein